MNIENECNVNTGYRAIFCVESHYRRKLKKRQTQMMGWAIYMKQS